MCKHPRVGAAVISAADMARTDSLDPDYYTQSMSLLCPLDDEHLPMEAANLKTRQVNPTRQAVYAIDAHHIAQQVHLHLSSASRPGCNDQD